MTEGAIRLSAIAGVDHPACKISHIAYLALRRRGEIATIDRRKGKAFNLPNIFIVFQSEGASKVNINLRASFKPLDMNTLVKLPTNQELPCLCLGLNLCASIEAITLQHRLREAS